jgi:hypothetical protein
MDGIEHILPQYIEAAAEQTLLPPPHTHRNIDAITICVLQVMPIVLATTYMDLWREENNLDSIIRLIHKTTQSFKQECQERLAEPVYIEIPANAPIHTEPSVAITASKRILIKGIQNIKEYNSHIKDDTAQKYLRDYKHYFHEIA